MKKIKKISKILIVFLLVFLLTGCTKQLVVEKTNDKGKKTKKAKVVLKKITKVKGVRYQIKYASNKKFKKAKVKTFKNNKITIKKLKVRRNYYIKARAYAKGSNGEKVYGKWTKRKMIKFRKKK